nr:ATP-binding cassette domain-containing protein [Rathayibacter rathayi]
MLSAQGVDFSYDSRTPILTNWSGRFDPGEVVAITGASGRGKSTLLYLLGLMLRPQSGSVLVGGVSVAGMNDALRLALTPDGGHGVMRLEVLPRSGQRIGSRTRRA